MQCDLVGYFLGEHEMGRIFPFKQTNNGDGGKGLVNLLSFHGLNRNPKNIEKTQNNLQPTKIFIPLQ